MPTLTDEFLLELINAVQSNLNKKGYHELSREEMESLWESEGHRDVRWYRMHHFANACGAHLEADRDLSRARLVNRQDSEAAPVLPLLRMAQPARRSTTRSW